MNQEIRRRTTTPKLFQQTTQSTSIENDLIKHQNSKSFLQKLPLFLFPIYVFILLLIAAYRWFHILPAPYNNADVVVNWSSTEYAISKSGRLESIARFSEFQARQHISYLTSNVGMRVAGTKGMDMANAYVISKLEELKELRVKKFIPEFDIEMQYANGTHLFDILGYDMHKAYLNLTNVVARISCGPECDKHTVLVNGHLDTFLDGVGASDDASGVSVILEIARIMVQRRTPLKNSIILLFNGGEETLQDASHAFITQHRWRDSIKAVINLEGCGSGGREVLFQSNSPQIVEAYAKAPYPYGATLTNDVFASGLIGSDTDYRQFVNYGNLIGLDMAFVANSYVYHTLLDIEETIQPGSIQNMGENTLAILEYLVAEADLTKFEKKSDMLYYDVLGLFFYHASWSTALIHHSILSFIALVAVVTGTVLNGDHSQIASMVMSTWVAFASYVSSILFAILVGLWMCFVVKTPQTWFSREGYPFLLFLPAMVLGIMCLAYISRFGFTNKIKDPAQTAESRERLSYKGLILHHTFFLMISTYFKLGIAGIFVPSLIFLTLGYIVDGIIGVLRKGKLEKLPGNYSSINGKRRRVNYSSIHFVAYYVAVISAPVSSGFVWAFMEAFVPLTGRMGAEIASDAVVAGVFSLFAYFIAQLTLPLAQRMSTKDLKLGIQVSAVITAIMILIFSTAIFPYDELHPKRLMVVYTRNATSGDRSVILSQIDRAAFPPILERAEKELGVKGRISADVSDLVALYPLSHHMGSYVFNVSHIPVRANNEPPQLHVLSSEYNTQTDERTLTIKVDHPHHVGIVLCFEAPLIEYSIEGLPQLEHSKLDGKTRPHGFRLVTGPSIYSWHINMTTRGAEKIKMELAGLDRNHWDELERMEFHPQANHEKRHIWSEKYAAAELMNRIGDAMPSWTTHIFLSVDTVTMYI